MKRYCLLLDLVEDKNLIEEYEFLHKNIPKEIKDSILESGILKMEIYRFQNRLMMIMEVSENFDFAKKANMDAQNAAVQEWEQRMWKFQKALPNVKEGEKWMLMNKIFELND